MKSEGSELEGRCILVGSLICEFCEVLPNTKLIIFILCFLHAVTKSNKQSLIICPRSAKSVSADFHTN